MCRQITFFPSIISLETDKKVWTAEEIKLLQYSKVLNNEYLKECITENNCEIHYGFDSLLFFVIYCSNSVSVRCVDAVVDSPNLLKCVCDCVTLALTLQLFF